MYVHCFTQNCAGVGYGAGVYVSDGSSLAPAILHPDVVERLSGVSIQKLRSEKALDPARGTALAQDILKRLKAVRGHLLSVCSISSVLSHGSPTLKQQINTVMQLNDAVTPALYVWKAMEMRRDHGYMLLGRTRQLLSQ